ncbi:MAG: dihydrofolate reductase family protein [Bacteroidia bacterium]
MRKLTAFNFITLNGFFKGLNADISWHRHGGEEGEFSSESLKSGNTLLFGRVTYEMMSGYWTTPMAMQNTPEVAEGMNSADKIVFSKTLKKADWKNTTLIRTNIVEEIKKLKKLQGNDMTILGSGSIITLFAEHDLIDVYSIMIDPVAIGEGTPLFNNVSHKLDMELTATRTFKSGVVLLNYRPMKK